MTPTSFPDAVTPFPDAGEILYGHRTTLYSSPETELPFQSPPQKLRPIRCNKKDSMEHTDFSLGLNEGEKDIPGSFTSCNGTAFTTLPELPPPKLNLVTGSDDYLAECSDSLMSINDELQEKGVDAGNRWSEAETLALLKIRFEMDAEFRDANPKGRLWEIVSWKLERLGYHRASKKCKEKFENIYKYYKRTKERRVGSQTSNAYKFFNELEALHCPENKKKTNPIAETALLDKTGDEGLYPVEVPTKVVRLGTDSTDFH